MLPWAINIQRSLVVVSSKESNLIIDLQQTKTRTFTVDNSKYNKNKSTKLIELN